MQCTPPRRNRPKVSAAAAFVSTVSCIGVSHRGAPLEVLERLAIPPEALPRALRHFAARGPAGERLREGVILSTCNRTEIYSAGGPVQPADGMPEILSVLPAGLVDVLSESSGLSRADLAGRMIRYDGWAAAEHLFRVVCGLDSLVVGESQVAGQVARAYAAAQRAGPRGSCSPRCSSPRSAADDVPAPGSASAAAPPTPAPRPWTWPSRPQARSPGHAPWSSAPARSGASSSTSCAGAASRTSTS